MVKGLKSIQVSVSKSSCHFCRELFEGLLLPPEYFTSHGIFQSLQLEFIHFSLRCCQLELGASSASQLRNQSYLPLSASQLSCQKRVFQ